MACPPASPPGLAMALVSPLPAPELPVLAGVCVLCLHGITTARLRAAALCRLLRSPGLGEWVEARPQP